MSAALGRLVPHLPLAALPTPLDAAPALGAALGAPALLIKNDALAGSPYGGNKVRKLEYLLAEAVRQGCDAVLTFGAAGSHHALATAIYARAVGLACHAVLVDQPPGPAVARTLRWHARLGTALTVAPGFVAADAAAARIRAAHPAGADRLYVIPWGGSSPLGCAGFVAAGFELAAQLRAAGVSAHPRVYLPCGTMGSVAGLLLGLRLAGCPATVVAVRVVPQAPVNATAVEALCRAALARLRALDGSFPAHADGPAVLEFREGFLGDGYGVATPEGLAAAALARELAGLCLETTYAAKALACLAADARARRAPDDVPVFWLTCNGQPYPAGLDDAPVEGLPPALRRYLEPAPR